METLTFTQITRENQKQHEELLSQWIAYIREVDEHENKSTSDEKIIHDLQRRINIQGKRKDMHFEVCYQNDDMIGFANFAIDLGTLYGLFEYGYGTVMELYISPEYRRKGFGSLFYEHIEETLKYDGAKKIYLTPDSIAGRPFWYAMGFRDSGKIDPDNNLPIFIKQVHSNT